MNYDELDFEQLVQQAEGLMPIHDKTNLELGQLALVTLRKFGESKLVEMASRCNISTKLLREYMKVARAFSDDAIALAFSTLPEAEREVKVAAVQAALDNASYSALREARSQPDRMELLTGNVPPSSIERIVRLRKDQAKAQATIDDTVREIAGRLKALLAPGSALDIAIDKLATFEPATPRDVPMQELWKALEYELSRLASRVRVRKDEILQLRHEIYGDTFRDDDETTNNAMSTQLVARTH
jgi:hypothetical protein